MPRQPTAEYLATRRMYSIAMPPLFETFRSLEDEVPPPRAVHIGRYLRYRYVEKLPQQAIVAKLAHVLTGLQSIWILVGLGLTQEAAALQRILDEIGEDIQFLAGPLVFGEKLPNHKRFLDEFFQEEFEIDENPLDGLQKRDRVPRKKIRAYNARTYSGDGNYDSALKAFGTIGDTYSGFVHAAGSHIMDMWGGDPPHFHIQGMNGTPRVEEALADYRNYLLRGIMDTALGAKAIGLEEQFTHLKKLSDDLAMEFHLI